MQAEAQVHYKQTSHSSGFNIHVVYIYNIYIDILIGIYYPALIDVVKVRVRISLSISEIRKNISDYDL